MRTSFILLSALLFGALACGEGVAEADGGADAGAEDAGVDGGAEDAGSDAGVDGGRPPFDPGPTPTAPLEPVFGELSIWQLDLPIGLTVQMGEAAIVIGPDGTLVLVDVGDSGHDDNVREVVRRLNTQLLVPARGYPARGPLQVEWVVLTHHHRDHMGGVEDLLVTAGEPLDVRRGVIHRGLVELGSGMSQGDWATFCDLLRAPLAPLDHPLCVPSSAPVCDGATSGHPVANCDGLSLGRLEDPSDDAIGLPTELDLGGGATLRFLGASGWVFGEGGPAGGGPITNDHGDAENAMSVSGMVSHGAFRHVFAGDLNGAGGSDGPDTEGWIVARVPALLLDGLGVDVSHANHHARRTSSGPAWVEWLAPADGRGRTVIAGINAGYLGSPQGETLGAWLDGGRLTGGAMWVTATTVGSGNHPDLVDADGPVIVQTVQGGRGYWVQAAGGSLSSRAHRSVRDLAR